MSILDYIERIKRENEGPRITAQEPRTMAQGGVIGKPGGLVEPGVKYYGKEKIIPYASKILSTIKKPISLSDKFLKNLDLKLAGEAVNFYKNKTVIPKTQQVLKKKLNKIFNKERENNPVLQKIAMNKVSKEGEISYIVGTPEGYIHGKGLEDIVAKKNVYFSTKEKPLRDAGYISSEEAVKFLRDNGFSPRKRKKGFTEVQELEVKAGSGMSDPIVPILRNLSERYNMSLKQGPGYGGKEIFLKKADLEKNINQMVTDYLTKKDVVKIAKQLVEEHNLQSFSQLRKALKVELGKSRLSNADMNEFFPNLRVSIPGDKDFVYSAEPMNVIQRIRKAKIDEYGSFRLEQVLSAFKSNLGFGKKTHLMHPLTKRKQTESLYDPEDLIFGSSGENQAYNLGLEKIRNTIQQSLRQVRDNYSSLQFKENMTIKVSTPLRLNYDFPKTMPIKKYIDKLNYMLTDLSIKTGGKVRGALFDETKWKFIESKLGVNYLDVPGMGLIEGNLKSLDPLFQKVQFDKQMNLLKLDESGMPLLKIDPATKKPYRLSNEEAETLLTFLENMKEQVPRPVGSKPVTFEEMKEVWKRIPKNKGGRVGLADGTAAVADKSKLLFETGLSARDRAKIFGAAVAGDWLIPQLSGALTKASMKGLWKGLPILWTPGGEVIETIVHKLMSGKEPKLEDFAEGFKEAGYDINSEKFQKQWNSIPEEDRKEILYKAAGQVIDKRSTSEKIKETAASPLTHARYAFWKHGVESMQKLLAANPGSSALTNKLKQAALVGIRMGIPMQVISKLNPIGWTLTGATAYSKIQQEFEGKMRKTPLTESEQMDIQERKTAVPKMLDTYEQASKLAKDQGISYEDALKQLNKPNVPGIDFSLPKPIETLAGGGMVGIRRPSALPPTGGPMHQGLRSLYINDRDY